LQQPGIPGLWRAEGYLALAAELRGLLLNATKYKPGAAALQQLDLPIEGQQWVICVSRYTREQPFKPARWLVCSQATGVRGKAVG